ncbi:LytR C-terminal domain-containing protein [Streptomyces sp. CoH27]|uniref:LytR C-terminal domain-containing protein n=1 Tax=Streptomyces sp. CoH27 TaxID=2875763 RepID=UPI001CD294E9|nr:LytR C-terminal domain-containing protein [Streptomyces sp. CoH27]
MNVLNGNGGRGLASGALSSLVELGYTVGTTGNTATQPATTVRYDAGAQQAAQQIAGRLHASTAISSAAVPAGHVVVALGEDYTHPGQVAPTQTATASASNTATADDSGPAVKAGGAPCVN